MHKRNPPKPGGRRPAARGAAAPTLPGMPERPPAAPVSSMLEPTGADLRRILAAMHYSVARRLVRWAGARRPVRLVEFVDGAAAPSWEPLAHTLVGLREWRLASRVTVGREWLALHFPASWARHRLLAEPLKLSLAEIYQFERKAKNTMTPSINHELADWLKRRLRAKHVRDISIHDDNSPPSWERAPGVTHWKNRRPRRYERSISIVHVGAVWLAKAFPAAWARMRLMGNDCLIVTADELKAYEQAERTKTTTEAFSKAAFLRNALCWQDVVLRKATYRSTDPENERHYAP